LKNAITTDHYILHENKNMSISILLDESATSSDILKAFYESHRAMEIGVKATKVESAATFPMFVEGLKKKGWNTEDIVLSDEGWRFQPNLI
jgi:hypothetical protein